MRSQCAFASDEWRTVPFLLQPKLPIDELIDILLYLPRCLVIETQLKALDAYSDPAVRRQLTKKLSDLLKQPTNSLSAWWSKYNHDHMMDIPNSTTAGTDAASTTEAFVSPLAATSVAYYYSAQAIVTCLSDLAAPSKQSYELLVHDISVILSAVKYHRVRVSSVEAHS
jgi:hypothetical protein